MNSLLPEDIRVYAMQIMPLSFHPTLESLGKEYHYHVSTTPWLSPFQRHFMWHFPKKLELELMQKASLHLLGKKDFSALTNTRKPDYENRVREIFSIDITQEGENFCFRIRGDHFLYKMVRNIVGTLCYVGCGKLSIDAIEKILESKQRAQAGMTAPACGLVLKKVYYPEDV